MSVLRSCLLTLALIAANGCTLMNLREESREFDSATVLAGRATSPSGWHGPVVVAAVNQQSSRPVIAHSVWLHEPGAYELIVPAGKYTLVAYGDSNGNGVFDGDDPAAAQATPVDATGMGMITMLDLTLTDGLTDAVRAHLPSGFRPPSLHSTQAGALADLDAAAFSAENGRRGYWSPLDTFRQVGGNIYFLEPYDPGRVPVLFVHGAAGSPQDWRRFFDRIDRSRYQPWFFQYPSGASLESMSHLLYWKLLNLQLRYGFAKLHVVAHSMGGLVVRRFMLDHAAHLVQLDRFVTLSTPWAGESAAALGVEHSPAVVPSWRDLQPEGSFLQTLFDRPLPANVRHTLLFGHRGGYNLLRPTTDGTVTLASQLRPAAQSEAQLVMGFDEDHTSILTAPAVMQQVWRALDGSHPQATTNGRLELGLEYASDTREVSLAAPFLQLTPIAYEAERGRPILLPLLPGRRNATLGPIAAGTYELQLMLPGFRTAPARQQVTIPADELATASFKLAPQGVLAAYVGMDGDSAVYPAGSFRPPHPSVVIERVSIDGPGGRRTLVPRREGDPDIWPAYVDGRDDAAGPMFCFANLAAGEYELEIIAAGYEPYRARHSVAVGVSPPSVPIVLRPRAARATGSLRRIAK